MKIAVVGAGGVGGYFGGMLARAGEDVTFIARGAHLAAMQRNGLKVESQITPFSLASVKATDDASSVGPVDLVLLSVKLYDVESAARASAPMVGPSTVVMPVQNGVDAPEIVAGALGGKGTIVGGIAYIAGQVEAPGVIRHNGMHARLVFGPLDGKPVPTLAAFATACNGAGFKGELVADARTAMWEKFVFLATMSGMTALTRHTIGPIRTNPTTRAMLVDSIDETVAVARALGVSLPADLPARTLALVDGLPVGGKASMAHDLDAGRRIELPWLSGTVARLGAANGVPTPIHRAITGALSLFVDGKRA
ncbi:MAG: ketopantoate reductase family protein [Alphaproteobacteria bacterium]